MSFKMYKFSYFLKIHLKSCIPQNRKTNSLIFNFWHIFFYFLISYKFSCTIFLSKVRKLKITHIDEVTFKKSILPWTHVRTTYRQYFICNELNFLVSYLRETYLINTSILARIFPNNVLIMFKMFSNFWNMQENDAIYNILLGVPDSATYKNKRHMSWSKISNLNKLMWIKNRIYIRHITSRERI